MASLTLDPRVTQTPSRGQPVVRMTAGDRVTMYQNNADYLYTKNTPFTENSTMGVGPKQPFIYVFANESTAIRNFTYFDTRALPIGSTARDAKRIGQYLITTGGIAYLALQALLQQQNAFNETRIYNPASVLKATVRKGATGAIEYPIRHVPTNSGLGNAVANATRNTFGLPPNADLTGPIEGTATGVRGALPWSTYAGFNGGARAGTVRFGTASGGTNRFNRYWVSSGGPPPAGGGGFLSNLGQGLIGNLRSKIPSTNPLGAFGGNAGTKWEYRPEYPTGEYGAYYRFLTDSSGLFNESVQAPPRFYNMGVTTTSTPTVKTASSFHKYYPNRVSNQASTGVLYANNAKITGDAVGTDGGLKTRYNQMLNAITGTVPNRAQFKAGAHMYSDVRDSRGRGYMPYKQIPSNASDPNYYSNSARFADIKMDKKGFLKSPRGGGIYDEYNKLLPIKGKRGTVPNELLMQTQADQSKDLIFFYFFDLINKLYIPFRATLKQISDQHTPDLDTIPYLGRADRLYLYRGFTRDVGLSFEVYANSVTEMIPMWKRINYLVGLTRPAKYTGRAVTTGIEKGIKTTGKESSFMYPPMITMRIGDLFVDQPCMISNCSVTIPQETNWETLRSDSDYTYAYSATKKPYSLSESMSNQLQDLQAEQANLLKNVDNIAAYKDNINAQQDTVKMLAEKAKSAATKKITDGKSVGKETAFVRQLPMKADITLNLKLLEKERAETGNDLYGFNMKLAEG